MCEPRHSGNVNGVTSAVNVTHGRSVMPGRVSFQSSAVSVSDEERRTRYLSSVGLSPDRPLQPSTVAFPQQTESINTFPGSKRQRPSPASASLNLLSAVIPDVPTSYAKKSSSPGRSRKVWTESASNETVMSAEGPSIIDLVKTILPSPSERLCPFISSQRSPKLCNDNPSVPFG